MNDERLALFNANLKFYENEYNKGDITAIFDAYEYCVDRKLNMPGWIINEIYVSFRRFTNLEAKTLDQAFGIEPKKYKKIHKERKWREEALRTYQFILDWERQGKAIDFIEIAKALGNTSDFTVKKMYKYVREETRLGQLFEINRKSKLTEKLNKKT